MMASSMIAAHCCGNLRPSSSRAGLPLLPTEPLQQQLSCRHLTRNEKRRLPRADRGAFAICLAQRWADGPALPAAWYACRSTAGMPMSISTKQRLLRNCCCPEYPRRACARLAMGSSTQRRVTIGRMQAPSWCGPRALARAGMQGRRCCGRSSAQARGELPAASCILLLLRCPLQLRFSPR